MMEESDQPKFLLLGPATIDTIKKRKIAYKSVGGPIYYQTSVLSALGAFCTAVISFAPSDTFILEYFPQDVIILPVFHKNTMEFENCYPSNDPNQRIQKAVMPSNSIRSKDIGLKNFNDFNAAMVSPLSPLDVPLDTIKYLSKKKIPIFLGAQGYLRHLADNRVILKPWDSHGEYLPFINMIFLDEIEAEVIIGKNSLSLSEVAKKLAELGPAEVIITKGDRGSLIYSKQSDDIYKIPAKKAHKIEDPTGLGDTYMAAYVYKRLMNFNPEISGRFASKLAALKIGQKGPITSLNLLNTK